MLGIFKYVRQVEKSSWNRYSWNGFRMWEQQIPRKPFKIPVCIFRYSVDRHTDMDRIFNIDSGNGSIFTSKLLDRETLLWHNITVIATEISKYNLIPLLPPSDSVPARAGEARLKFVTVYWWSCSIYVEGKSPVTIRGNVSSRHVLVYSQMQRQLWEFLSLETTKWECISPMKLNWYMLDLIPKSL